MDHTEYNDDYLREILNLSQTIAIVGFSANPSRPSHSVAAFLQDHGHRIIPVNPGLSGKSFLGEMVYASLKDIPFAIDMVDIFRRSEEVAKVVDEAIEIKAKIIWMQFDVRDDQAALKAEKAGLKVVMDRCPKVEIARLIQS